LADAAVRRRAAIVAAPAQPEEWQKELRMCPFVNVLKPGATLVNVGASVTLSDETLAKLDEFWPGPGGEAPAAYAC
jgi:hypothetical protein